MLFQKTTATGIDVSIQRLQSYLHSELLAKWDIDTADYECYGRCYRNQKEQGYIPEVFKGGTNGKEYHEVLLNDKVKAVSFFGVGANTTIGQDENTAQVHLIFWVNLKELSTATHRADEEIRNDVQQLLDKGLYMFIPTAAITGIDGVLTEYTGWRNTDNVNFRDMHPYHCFRFNMNLTYDYQQICSFPING